MCFAFFHQHEDERRMRKELSHDVVRNEKTLQLVFTPPLILCPGVVVIL